MSARKIAFLVLIVAFAATVETAWNVRGDVRIGPEGCRVIGGRFYGPSWSFESDGEQAVATDRELRLEVKNAFGEVRVRAGAPGVVRVHVRKVVFQPTEEKAREFAERIELRLTHEGALVRVRTNRDELRREDVGFETHLEIEAPPTSVVEVRSEHGRVELVDVAGADVAGSFGGVALERVGGDVRLESRHGDVRVAEVGGGLELDSRHGSVAVAGVAGAARLFVQHGGVEVERSAGLEVELAHGSLTAQQVRGDLLVRGQHAPVRAEDVRGRAEVQTSFGQARLARVGGELVAQVEHGSVDASDVNGSARLEASFDDVTLERVAGPVEATVEHGGFTGRGLAQGARVKTSGAGAELDGFAGPVEVEVERGSVRLAPGAALGADVVARASHGRVQLEVPQGSGFELDAESTRGTVEAPLEGLSTADSRRRGQRASGRHGGGGVSVRLKADDDVVLEEKPLRSRDGWAIAPPQLGGAGAQPRASEAAAAEPKAKKSAPAAEAEPEPKR